MRIRKWFGRLSAAGGAILIAAFLGITLLQTEPCPGNVSWCEKFGDNYPTVWGPTWMILAGLILLAVWGFVSRPAHK